MKNQKAQNWEQQCKMVRNCECPKCGGDLATLFYGGAENGTGTFSSEALACIECDFPAKIETGAYDSDTSVAVGVDAMRAHPDKWEDRHRDGARGYRRF